jgi:hypothetical protein
MKVDNRILVLTGLVMSLVVVTAGHLATASANGRVGELVKRDAGPYEVALGTIPDNPIVGTLHITMTVRDKAADEYVLDADVVITGVGPEGDAIEIGPLSARNSPTSPNFYEVNTEVDRTGVWVFTVTVDGGQGEASAEYPIKVKTASAASKVFTWVTVVMFFALVGLGLFPFIRKRLRGEKRSKI